MDAVCLELDQLDEYETFKDLDSSNSALEGYKRIPAHFVFDVKHDGWHKACFIAGGHLTEVPLDAVYSGVVLLQSLRMVVFLSELNGLGLWGADVRNAYLEAYTGVYHRW